jgi:cytoskeleton protein RodZ
MPEIGPTLREARMRARIDITEVEEATKIRAKYLRAIENEEWTLLPGSTFVKSFVREYADFLGLDSRLLVEEYKLRYEHPSEQELAPISPNLGRGHRAGVGPVMPRWAVIGLLVLVLLVGLALVGSLGGKDHKASSTGSGTTPVQRHTTTGASRHGAPTTTAAPAPAQASVRLIPTGTVYVCLVDQDGKVLIRGATFTAGQRVPVYRARSMRLTLGNDQLRLRVDGRAVRVPASTQAIAYELTSNGARPLAAGKAPTCA